MGRTFAGMEDHHTRVRFALLPPGARWILEKLQFVARWPLGVAEREREGKREPTRRAVSALNRFHFRSNFPNGSVQVGNTRALGLESLFSVRHRNNTLSSLKYLILRSLHFSNKI